MNIEGSPRTRLEKLEYDSLTAIRNSLESVNNPDNTNNTNNMKEYSIIHELFYGQFISETTCPECNHKTHNYEPYNTVNLPLSLSYNQIIMIL